MIYGDNPQKINEREDKLGLKTYSYAPQISAIMQAGNLYVYGINNPVAYSDRTGSVIESPLDLASFLLSVVDVAKNPKDLWAWAGLVGDAIDFIPGLTGVGETIKAIDKARDINKSVDAIKAAGEATGQLHHVLSNKIMRALNNHDTLKGLFNRNNSLVRALTPEAHRGYQDWHRIIDNIIENWLYDPKNANATAQQFLVELSKLYSSLDMLERFGTGVLEYLGRLVK